MSADLNLLFGMLALHNGFVSREQLLDALNAWMLHKDTPLGEIFRERGVVAEEDLRLLGGLVDRQIQLHGGAHKSLASLRVDPAARRDLEQLADADVKASLAATPRPETATVPPLSGAGVAGAERPVGEPRYRRLHFHARGGLGEVFVAVDEELNREVALKEIQAQFAEDADSRKRFVREAKITGSLEHPGVVPIYGLLSDGQGRPVYAMRFIKGKSLQDAIARFHAAEKPGRDPGERSLALRGLLARFVAVCNAVGYAHSRGIIHRDLKPANVMLGEYGETLLVDWGLARVLAQADPERTTPYSLLRLEDEDTATRLGQTLGTPAYMPPEQARGEHDRVSAASDVWALGATLYALLTGKAPYGGPDVMLKANVCEFPPPRQVNATVPRALAAVCLKAMASKIEDRYATARALAEEVEHWLADEPVAAYREPLRERARRWGRRNRTLVASAVVLLLASVVGLGVGLSAVGQERARTARQRDEALANLGRAERAEQEANENFEEARKAVDECFGLAKEDPLLQAENMSKVRKLLLQKTLPFYKSFVRRTPEDVQLLARQADYLLRVAEITARIDRKAESIASFEQARDIFERLIQAEPEVARHKAYLALTCNNLAFHQRDLGRRAEALTNFERARDIRQKLIQAYPEVNRYQADLALTYSDLGVLQYETGNQAESLGSFEKALGILQQLKKVKAEDLKYLEVLYLTNLRLGMLRASTGKPDEALECIARAREACLRISKALPENTWSQDALAGTYSREANVQRANGKPQEALKNYSRALDIQQRICKARPEVAEYQAGLAHTWTNLGALQSQVGKPEEALKSYEQARDIQLRLSKAHPEVTQYQADLAQALIYLGLLQSGTGKPQEALKSLDQARDIWLRLSQAHPEVTVYQAGLASAWNNLGNLQRETGKAEEALKSLNQAIPLLVAARQREPQNPTYRLYHRNAHRSRAETLGKLGRHRDAVADWDEALRLNTIPAHNVFLGFLRVAALARAGDHRRAMDEAEEIARGQPPSGSLLYNLACAAALSAAAVARDAGRPLPERDKQAEAWSLQAVDLLRRAAEAGYFDVPANRARLDKDDDLDFLRSRDDYAAFVRTLPPVAASGK
jgi:serine/threonine-protein kinase